MLTKAGVDLPPAALAGIPAALAVVSVVIHRRRAAVERELARQSRTVDGGPVAPRPGV